MHGVFRRRRHHFPLEFREVLRPFPGEFRIIQKAAQIARTSSYIDHFLRVAQGNNDSLYLFEGPDIYAPIAWTVLMFVAAAWILKRRYVP